MALGTAWRLGARGPRWAFALACVAMVTLSLLPGESIPQALHFWDKAQHALGFVGLAGLAAWGRVGSRIHWVVGLLLLGAAIEAVQALLPWRFGDWQDGLANAIGVACVLGMDVALSARRPTPT